MLLTKIGSSSRAVNNLLRTYSTTAHAHAQAHQSSWSNVKGKGKEITQDTDGWETVIGLEIHAQIKTPRKLFSHASTSYGDVPNTNVDLQDAAFPGTLPVLNLHAVRLSLLTALALGCTINPRSTFDRKHYFYHDIPASYQITQHYNPLARKGKLRISQGDDRVQRSFDVRIHQLQIEQDTAKSQTVGNNVLVDLNRAGTGLMEIVTEPDMRTAAEAGAFVKKLQALLRRVGSADGDMEKGNLRIDVNVSVNRPGSPFGTRCEIKNINSVRFLQAAIESEHRRHVNHYTHYPSTPLKQETRGLNELTGETFSLRSKEEAEDYRYMPDSNLPSMIIEPSVIERMKSCLPELPWETVDRLVKQYGISKRDAETLLALDEYQIKGIEYFEQVAKRDVSIGKKAANWIVHEYLGQLGKANISWKEDIIPFNLMRELVVAVEGRKMTGTTGKSIIKHCIASSSSSSSAASAAQDISLAGILEQLDLPPMESKGGHGEGDIKLEELAIKAIDNQPKSVKDYKKGNENAIMRLVGEIMKISKGRADAKLAKEILINLLNK